MRESCTSGSVRGARGNSRPYRNVQARIVCCICSQPLLAPSDGLPRVTNSVAIGGPADMPRTRRARRSDAFDPEPTKIGSKCRSAASP
jgi:hypothetical protein